MEVHMRKVLLIILLAAAVNMVFGTCGDHGMGKMVFMTGDAQASAVFFGIVVEDIDAKTAEAMDYPYGYGILITTVVPGSPAEGYGLQANDVLTSIDGETVKDTEDFDEIREDLEPGEVVSIGYWRAGKDFNKEVNLQGRDTPQMQYQLQKQSTPSKVGSGGGSFIPMWCMIDMDDVNALLEGLHFKPIGDKGILMQGIGGKGHVGKGFFVGGVITSYSDNYKQNNPDSVRYHDYVRYENGFGGVTLDKRFPICKNFVGSLGVLLGGGGHTIELMHSNADYSWPDNNTEFTSGNYHSTINRSYMIVQPKAELMYRLLNWLSIRAEVGYVYGYTGKEGWQVQGLADETFYVKNSPNTPYRGLTFSIGPWFGF